MANQLLELHGDAQSTKESYLIHTPLMHRTLRALMLYLTQSIAAQDFFQA
jgi:hypothetical protein